MPRHKFEIGNKINLGRIPWNKGKKTGFAPWLDKKRSKEDREKMSIAHKGKHLSPSTEFKKGESPWNKGLKGFNAGENHPNWKGGKPKCRDCETQLVSIYAKYCGSCAHKGKRGAQWKGGITSSERLERVKFQHNVQKKVFKRDNYTCQLCGERGGKLQVDHIQSWTEYVELRFDINNCRTVCMECHYEITFGKSMPKKIKACGHNLKEVFLL